MDTPADNGHTACQIFLIFLQIFSNFSRLRGEVMDHRRTLTNESDFVIYTHYGSPHFDKSRFVHVRNTDRIPKPADGTGLWASRDNDPNGWAAWCRKNDYNADELGVFFRFTLPEARILTISELSDLVPLPKIHPWEYPGQLSEDDIPQFDYMNGGYVSSWCYLDFENLSEEYDAIELRNSGNFTYSLYGWDCDCLLVLKPDKIAEIS